MAKKKTNKAQQGAPRKKNSPGVNVWLMLTLVPVVIGVLLIFAWAMDFLLLDDAQVQLFVGILFFLLGFAASNAIQKRWGLAAGWGLLMVADLILLAWLNLYAQIAAMIVGAVGLGFIVVEFYRQYRTANTDKSH